jgi:transmembrane sensor
MHEDNNNPDYALIGKYLSGEATAGEAMQVDEWLLDPENKKMFDHIARINNHVATSEKMQLPPSSEGWQELQSNLIAMQQGNNRKMRLLYITIAASVAGLILMMGLTWYNKHETSLDKLAAHNHSVINRTANNLLVPHTLPDGSQITINAGGKISYSNSFNHNERRITLSGEAFFDVAPDKTRPFIVDMDALMIKVTGTSFNVRKRDKEEIIEVQVLSGKVEMHANNQVLALTKGQSGIFEKLSLALKLQNGFDINSVGYATKTFSFNDLSLKETCSYLERAFQVKIYIDEEKFADCRITASFENKPLTYILEVINATVNTSYRQQGNNYFIEGEGCK